MKPKTIQTITILAIFAFTSCQFNSTNQNLPADREEAEAEIAKFHKLLDQKNYKKTVTFFSPKFLEVTNKAELFNIYKVSDSLLGKVEHREVEKSETKVVNGSNPRSDYFFVYDAKRENFGSKEYFVLAKEDGKIKILTYRVQSEGFDQLEKSKQGEKKSAKPFQ